MKRYFIIGTDTDCGKTYVTARLVDYFKQQNQRVQAIKPVASGCVDRISEDAVCLDKHNGKLTQGTFWRLQRPIAPHIAAAEEGIALTADAIANVCQSFETDALDYLLIEGAGGLMVPLNPQETWLDFLRLTQIPVLLVVGMRLGCINHALLTDWALTTHHIECVGWVANCLDDSMLALPETIKTLKDRLSCPQWGTVTRDGSYDPGKGSNRTFKFSSISNK